LEKEWTKNGQRMDKEWRKIERMEKAWRKIERREKDRNNGER
jgi:hypothetical protein